MAKTWIQLTQEARPSGERGATVARVPVDHDAAGSTPAVHPSTLDLQGYQILERTMAGELPDEVAVALRVDVATVEGIIASAAFASARSTFEAGMARRIQRGAFGVAAIAKQESTGAMSRIVALSKVAGNEETKRKANLDVLAHAGIIPEKRVAVVSPDRVIDQLTADECERFARLGVMPERFREQMAPWVRGQVALGGPAAIEAEIVPGDDDDVDEEELGR